MHDTSIETRSQKAHEGTYKTFDDNKIEKKANMVDSMTGRTVKFYLHSCHTFAPTVLNIYIYIYI